METWKKTLEKVGISKEKQQERRGFNSERFFFENIQISIEKVES